MTNVAVVVLDTLRKDAFDEHFGWLPGTRYENAWSTSHWTVPAHASLFTGRYASEVGIYAGAQTFDCPEPLLAETLREAGYTTRAFSANPNVSAAFRGDRGFEQFEGSWRLDGLGPDTFDWDGFIARTRDMGPERFAVAAKECVLGDYATVPSLRKGLRLKLRDLGYGRATEDDGAQSALDLLRRTDFGDREFLFLNLMEAHTPYKPPESYRTVEDVELHGLAATLDEPTCDPGDVRRAYDDCVRYLADMYREIFDELREDFDFLVTLSDHGELLGEHGAWEHLYGIYPEVSHVPLSVYESGGEHDGIVKESVSLLDVYATVLSAAGLEPDGRGTDLREISGDRECLVEYHGISDYRKLALENKGFTDFEFLDATLDGVANDGYYGYETFDGFEERGESVYEDPQGRLAELVAELDRRDATEDEEVDEAVLTRLEDLGYA